MGVRRQKWLLLFMLLVANSVCLAKPGIQLKEAQWLNSDADKAKILTQRPRECLNPQAPELAVIGRIAFASSALLGGQAARMELSCASCHPSGRANAHFFINGVSTTPGTADVTHHFFSSNGGNNILAASIIPDLAKLEQSTIKDRWSDAFRNKIIQLIELEFDGQPAPEKIIDGLQTYLANIDIKYCKKDTPQTIGLVDDWQHLQDIANILADKPEATTNSFLIRAARKQIETVYWRFKNINNREIEDRLIQLSRELTTLNLNNIENIEKIAKIDKWMQSAKRVYSLLKHYQDESTYNEAVITVLINTSE